jgi:transcriptional regulator with XRE-family HTH domain
MATQSVSPVPQLGELLRHWRHERGKSQLDLSLDTGISQRHLSFVESGRSTPSRDFLSIVSDALNIPLRERNVLLLASGFAPQFSEQRIDGLRVNMDPYFSQLILGPQLSGFLKAYPELKVDLITREGLGDLISDGYDLGIRFGEPRPSTLVARRLLDTRVLTVASPGYLKKHGHPTDPQQLVAERHLMIDFRDPETGRPFEWVFRKGRKEIKVEMQSQLMPE